MGAEELVRRAGVEVAADSGDVDGCVGREVYAVDVEERSVLVHTHADHGQVGPGADEVGRACERDESRGRGDVAQHVLG